MDLGDNPSVAETHNSKDMIHCDHDILSSYSSLNIVPIGITEEKDELLAEPTRCSKRTLLSASVLRSQVEFIV